MTIPLRFSDYIKYLPLIPLAFHEVEVVVELEDKHQICHHPEKLSGHVDCKLQVEYIYLDAEERRSMAQEQMYFVDRTIKQIQVQSHVLDFTTEWSNYFIQNYHHSQGLRSILNSKSVFIPDEIVSSIIDYTVYDSSRVTKSINIPFSHPCSELIWIIKPVQLLKWFDYQNIITKATLRFNGQIRISQHRMYYTKVQHYQHHTNTMENVYCYSFCLRPEDNSQPSGSCNFSRIQSTTLELEFDTTLLQTQQYLLKIYAINYNVLRIKHGIGVIVYTT